MLRRAADLNSKRTKEKDVFSQSNQLKLALVTFVALPAVACFVLDPWLDSPIQVGHQPLCCQQLSQT
jgi:hypothetical protein